LFIDFAPLTPLALQGYSLNAKFSDPTGKLLIDFDTAQKIDRRVQTNLIFGRIP